MSASPPPNLVHRERRRVLQRIERLIRAIAGDQAFKERLAGAPRGAFGEHDIECEAVPAHLPPVRSRISVYLNEETIFGGGAAADAGSPPMELRLVAHGAKPMALAYGPERELAGYVAWAERHGLVGLLSSYEYTPHRDSGKGGFSNRVGDKQTARAGSGNFRGLVVARDEDRALLGWLCLMFSWDPFLGRLLGYPECCCEAFARRWEQAVARHQGDVAALALRDSGPGPFPAPANIFCRYFGRQLLYHFPCTLRCPASLEVARRYLGAVRAVDPAYAQSLAELLASPVVYTDTHGVFLFPGRRVVPHDGGYVLDYDPAAVRATDATTPVAGALLAADRLTLDPARGALTAGPASVPGELVWFEEEPLPAASAPAGAPGRRSAARRQSPLNLVRAD